MKRGPLKKDMQPLASSSVVAPSRSKNILFPIVGIGASAGGLEALEQFLGHVPEKSGMAFVIVQHLDPTHQGLLPELLQRTTGFPGEVFCHAQSNPLAAFSQTIGSETALTSNCEVG